MVISELNRIEKNSLFVHNFRQIITKVAFLLSKIFTKDNDRRGALDEYI